MRHLPPGLRLSAQTPCRAFYAMMFTSISPYMVFLSNEGLRVLAGAHQNDQI